MTAARWVPWNCVRGRAPEGHNLNAGEWVLSIQQLPQPDFWRVVLARSDGTGITHIGNVGGCARLAKRRARQLMIDNAIKQTQEGRAILRTFGSAAAKRFHLMGVSQ